MTTVDQPEETGAQPAGADGAGTAEGNREAAKYRRQLRQAEAERDALRARLDRTQRAEVSRLAADAGMRDPADLVIEDLADVLDEDGGVDAGKVGERIDAVRAERDYLFTPPPPPVDFGGGYRGTDIGDSGSHGLTWSDALNPDRR